MQKNISIITLVAMLFAFPGFSPSAHAETTIGQAAPSLVASELDGEAFDIRALKGKIVIVHFWATWCPSCLQEMPALDSFYRQYHTKGVEVIAVSADKARKRDDVLSVMKPFAFPAAMLSDISDNGFGTPDSLPITYIIDGSGIVRMRFTPEGDILTSDILAAKISPLLKSLQSGG